MKTRILGLVLLGALAGVVAANPGPDPLGEIRDLIGRSMFRTAGPKLDALLKEEPGSAGAHALLARMRLAQERYDEAEAEARRAVELEKDRAAWWLLWGRCRFEQGREAARRGATAEANRWRFEQAETGFRTAQRLEPENPDVLWWIGWAKEWQRGQDTAWQFFDAQLREFPRYVAGYRRMGQYQADRARALAKTDPAAAAKYRKDALATFDRGLEVGGEDAELLYLRALLLLDLGEKDKAVESLVRSVRADPDFGRAFHRLRTMVDETEVLVPLAIEVLGAHPDSALAAREAGYYTLNRPPRDGEQPWTRFELALTRVLPALEVHGDDAELYRIAFRAAQGLIGDTPRAAPNAKVAVDAFERIHRAYVWEGDAANNLGFYYREVGSYRESLRWYLAAVERAPENQDILNDTGLIYLFHFPDERAKGLPYFLKAVALVSEGGQKPERGYWDALENLCKHYFEVDHDPDKVIEYARLRYLVTKGVPPYNMSQVAESYAKRARRERRK